MPSDSAKPVLLKKEQVEKASEVLSRAFLNDPELLHFVPDPVKRQKLLLSMFKLALAHAVDHGEVYAVSLAIEGVAVWLPSDAPELSFWATLRGGGLGLLFRMNRGFLRKMKEDEDFALKLRRQLAPSPHLHLDVMYQGARGDLLHGQGIARFDLGIGARFYAIVHLKLVGGEYIALIPIGIEDEGDTSRAIGVVFNGGHAARDAQLIALEVQHAQPSLGATAAVAYRYLSLVTSPRLPL